MADGKLGWLKKFVTLPTMLWIGEISFPLYLWHWPLLFFARNSTDRSLSSTVIIVVLIVSILLAWLTYKLVEQPIRRNLLNIKKCIALLGAMLALGVTGYCIVWNKGVPSRFPSEAGAMTNAIDFKWGDHVRIDVCHLQGKRSLDFPSICSENTKPSIA